MTLARRAAPLLAFVLLATALAGCDADTGATDAPRETLAAPTGSDAGQREAVRVLHISVDGLRADAVSARDDLPGFTRLRAEGASTFNARSDADYRTTLPNHTCQLTGRPVLGARGHGWNTNADSDPGVTIHSNAGHYIPSVFDVAHDHGRTTAAYVSKTKFSLFQTSYDADHGAPDTTGADDGRGKIDRFVLDTDTETLVDRLIADLRAAPADYTFLHLRDPDAVGHVLSWSLEAGSPYALAVEHVDRLLTRILDAVEADPRLADHTIVVLTADHGGLGMSHSADIPEAYTVPFCVWGAAIHQGDLYEMSGPTRRDPGRLNIPAEARPAPIRNADAPNLSLQLLELPAIPGSSFGVADPLNPYALPR